MTATVNLKTWAQSIEKPLLAEIEQLTAQLNGCAAAYRALLADFRAMERLRDEAVAKLDAEK